MSAGPRLASARVMTLLSLALAGVSVAVWLWPASVHVVGWDGGVARRVLLLPSFGRLGTLLATAVGSSVAAWWLLGPSRSRGVARIVAPLGLLWLWAVPYLPGLADRFPLVLVLTGPLRWVVAGLAMLGVLLAAARYAVSSEAWNRVALPGPRAVFVITVLVLAVASVYTKRWIGFVGDEPHYLVVTHSLVADGDLRIENNHEAGDYQAFYGGVLPMHYVTRGVDDVVYSIHAPGLPALVAPVYAVAGSAGVVAVLIGLAALTAVLVFVLAERLTSRRVAVVTWVAMAFTVPFFFQSWMVFPELPAATVVALAMVWLWTSGDRGVPLALGQGLALGLLPWLHVKYSLLLVVLLGALVVRAWPRWRSAVALCLPVGLSGVSWLLAFQVMYGRLDPTAPYGPSRQGVDFTNVPRGALGLLFDQEFGLVVYSPIYLLAAGGAWLAIRDRRLRGPALGTLVALLTLVVSVTTYYMWWGGYSLPARFLVPALPLLAPMVAVGLTQARGAVGVGVAGLLLATSLGSTIALLVTPARRLMFNDRDGTSRLVEAWQGALDVTSLLPSFVGPDWVSPLSHLGTWALAGVVATLGLLGLRRLGPGRLTPFAAAVTWLVGSGAVVCLVVGTGPDDRYRASVARIGQADLQRGYDGGRLTPYRSDLTGSLGTRELLGRMTRRWPVEPDAMPSRGLIAGPFALLPGEHDVTVWFDADRSPRGQVWLRYDKGPAAVAVGRVRGGTHTVMRVDLPLELDEVWLGASSPELAAAASAVAIRPRALTPRHARVSVPDVVAVRRLTGERRHLFFLDASTFQERERWWIRGDETASLLVSPAGGRRVSVRVQRGAAGGDTRVTLADVEDTGHLPAGRQRGVSLDLDGTEVVVPVSVHCANGFRPADRNRASNDTRYLGCQVTVDVS